MGKGGRRGRGRVGRVGSRSLDVADGTVVVVIVVVLVGVGPRHVVGREASRVAARVHAGAVVGVMAGAVAVAVVLALDLVSSLCQHGDVAVAVVVVNRRLGRGKRGKRVRRGDVWRGQGRSGSGADGLGRRRRHQALRVHVRWQALVHGMLMLEMRLLVLLRELLLVVMLLLGSLVAATRVGVVVNSRVAGELVGAGELLAAAGELAGVRLLASVGADVSRLVLEAVEGLVTEGALVGARQLVGGALGGLGTGERAVGLDDGDSCGSHVCVAVFRSIAVGAG